MHPQTTTAAVGAAHALEPTDGPLLPEELQLAFRNRGMPLEALRYGLTPTGLRYLVAHWDIPQVAPAAWRLRIGGRVREPLELTLDELRARPRRTIPVTLECAGNGRGWLRPRPISLPWLGEAIGMAEWTGTALGAALEEAGLLPDAVEVVFRGADRGIQGGEEHGMTSVKWLTSIEVVAEPFEGFQQAVAYRYQQDADDPGEPVARMRVRALMLPPGIPDFFSRRRFVAPGPVKLCGRAWSGNGLVERVEVAVDGRWAQATLGSPVGAFGWRGWWFNWQATPGEHELACLRLLFGAFCDDQDEVEARCMLFFSLWIGNHFIAADHGPRSRAEVLKLALRRLQAW